MNSKGWFVNNQESELVWNHGTYLTLLYMIISLLHYLVSVKGTYISTISDLVIAIMWVSGKRNACAG